MAPPLVVTFQGGEAGRWRIDQIDSIVGQSLDPAPQLAVVEGLPTPATSTWALRGFTSNERYVVRSERTALTAVQQPLGRPFATRAALIPIRKSPAWWEMTQDERRDVLEQRSRHIGVGLEYLPAVSRRLHHARDLGEPFDFLTWFEFAPADATAFEELVARLRATEEWSFVDREVDIRLSRDER